jgi:hypothetical protein
MKGKLKLFCFSHLGVDIKNAKKMILINEGCMKPVFSGKQLKTSTVFSTTMKIKNESKNKNTIRLKETTDIPATQSFLIEHFKAKQYACFFRFNIKST